MSWSDALRWIESKTIPIVASIFCYFDESGKFKDQSTISLCGTVGTFQQVETFSAEWHYHLRRSGLGSFTMKQALNARRDLSGKLPSQGIKSRTSALMPFVDCIRTNLEFAVASVMNVGAFKGLPSETKRVLGVDPYFTCFQRNVLSVLDHISNGKNTLSIICDEEESTALPTFELYRRFKKGNQAGRAKLTSFSMADDKAYCPIQAADLIASLFRLEGMRRFHGIPYDYEILFNRLTSEAEANTKLHLDGGFWSEKELKKIADGLFELKRKHRLSILPDIGVGPKPKD